MILFVLPTNDFDPTETAVPWALLRAAGYEVRFATPDGRAGAADERLIRTGFGPLTPILMTRAAALDAYRRMAQDPAFLAPLAYADVDPADYDGLLVPGGHAAGMRSMLEPEILRSHVVAFFRDQKPVAAICHGVLLLARSVDPATGRSVLYGRRTTALTRLMELSAWQMTRRWLGDYYRTYPTTVQDEVTAALRSPADFAAGPLAPVRDSARHPERGFVVRDGAYLSARWPGDAYRFANEFIDLLRLYETWRDPAARPDALQVR